MLNGILPVFFDKGTPVVRRGRRATRQRTLTVAGHRRGRSSSPERFSGPQFLAMGVALATLLATATPVVAGVLHVSWTMPTTNADGSALTDLASFKVYYGRSNAPCRGASFISVTAPTSAPEPNQTATTTLTGLATGKRYFAAVTTVNSDGTESACSRVGSAVARSDFSVIPSGTVDFGSVTIGTTADQTFTVQNTDGGTVSGTVTTSAPFSVVSGGSFTLVGVGATTPVTVRFAPVVAAMAITNVTFTANGGSVSRRVTGTGARGNTPGWELILDVPPALCIANAGTVKVVSTGDTTGYICVLTTAP
jgi:hypothetical protein